jgi:hypothetical protein
MAQAAGVLGWTERQFWFSTPRYLRNAVAGYQAREEQRQLGQLRAARIVAFYAVTPYAEKGAINTFTDLFLLPGEESEQERNRPTPEQMEAFFAQADAVQAKKLDERAKLKPVPKA